MSGTDMIGEYSPKMMWDTILMTNDKLEEHCRVNKNDFDKLHNDNTEIKQSIAELSQSVSLLTQKIECAPVATYTIPASTNKNKYAWVTGAVIAALFGISQFWEYLKK